MSEISAVYVVVSYWDPNLPGYDTPDVAFRDRATAETYRRDNKIDGIVVKLELQ